MVKKLRFSKIELVERVGALMLVSFLDDDANMYQWAAKWSQVEEIYLKQINVERYNKPESKWLNRDCLATLPKNVCTQASHLASKLLYLNKSLEAGAWQR